MIRYVVDKGGAAAALLGGAQANDSLWSGAAAAAAAAATSVNNFCATYKEGSPTSKGARHGETSSRRTGHKGNDIYGAHFGMTNKTGCSARMSERRRRRTKRLLQVQVKCTTYGELFRLTKQFKRCRHGDIHRTHLPYTHNIVCLSTTSTTHHRYSNRFRGIV